jgi:hypothetical protein
VRGLSDLPLLETPDEALLRELSGLQPEPSSHVLLDKGLGVRATQRLAVTDVGGGIAVFTWPAELQPQAKYLYSGDRAKRLLAAAADGAWDVDLRPHLAFWLSNPEERLYLNPTLTTEEYVARWTGPDRSYIRQHAAETIRNELWPWLLERGYASPGDELQLGPFLQRLRTRRRPAHMRPGLRLLRRWGREEADELRRRGSLVAELRAAVNRLLEAVGDPALPKHPVA